MKSDGLTPPGGTEAYALARAATSSGEAICIVGSDDDGVKSMVKNGDGEYTAVIPAFDFDPNIDEMYYFELVDKFGNGSFYPDAFTAGRYYVIKIAH